VLERSAEVASTEPDAGQRIEPKEQKRRRRRLVRVVGRVAPYVVAILAAIAIFRRYDVREILGAMRAGNALAMIPIALGSSIAQILLLACWDTILLRSVVRDARLRLLEVLGAKAGCGVLQAIAYVANQGAYGVWIARALRIGARNAAALVALAAVSDFIAGSVIMSTAIWLGRANVPAILRYGAPGFALLLAVLLLAPRRVPFDPYAVHSFRRVWTSVPRARVAAQLAGRLTNASVIGVGTFFSAGAFGLEIPLSAMLTWLPIISVVASLPINVAGIGAVQGAWLVFLPWASGPRLLAFHFLWSAMVMASQVLRGLPFVRHVAAEVAAREVEPETASLTSVVPAAPAPR
jgi:hypothetical protein